MALKPPKRQRPLIAIIGINDATEATDYLVPFGILRRSDVAEVVLLATGLGPVKLYPALEVEAHATIATFDAQHPEGARPGCNSLEGRGTSRRTRRSRPVPGAP
jgi:putative intracellular protease/amidase